jgi:orotate phosphoribosyltransferase-like protein
LPVYVRIADKAKHLRDLGMSDRAIARALRVSDKTVAKAAGAVDVHVPGP